MKPILIFGAGNLLQTDDGAGVRVVHYLHEHAPALLETADIVDGGTAGYDLTALLMGRERIIIVDAVLKGDYPGQVVRFSPDLTLRIPALYSLHHANVLDALRLLTLYGETPAVEVVGIAARDVNTLGIGLSPEVEAALPTAAEMILSMVPVPIT